MTEQTFDYIIVGAGSSGCVMANRLSACGKYKVALIEAGGKDSSPLIKLPVGFVSAMSLKSINWRFKTSNEQHMEQRQIDCPRGKVLGGSSSINGMIYIRGHQADFDHWSQLGCKDWAYEDVLPWFKNSEAYLDINTETNHDNPYHGSDGELSVSQASYHHPLTDLYIRAGMQAGLPKNDDFNGAQQAGIGLASVNITPRGIRASSAQAFLPATKSRKNFVLISHAHVLKIALENGRATGVHYKRKGKTIIAKAAKEVVLCAGAIGSPQLLQCSGIGESNILEKAGVQVIHELVGVGENLQDHLTIDVVSKVKNIGTSNDNLKPLNFIGQLFKYLIHRKGFLSMPSAHALAFIKNTPEQSRPDLQIHFAPAAGERNAAGQVMPSKIPAITSTCCNLQPSSRGSVHINTADSTQPPTILFNYLATQDDRNKMIAAVKWQRKILEQPALSTYIVEELRPGVHINSDEQILSHIRQRALSIYHPVGTCKMGIDAMSVVDPRLKVHGIEALRVVDASVMPTIVSGNTNAACIMIAEKGANYILEDAKAYHDRLKK